MRRFIEAGIIAATVGLSVACAKTDTTPFPTDTIPASEAPACPNFRSNFYPYTMECPQDWEVNWAYDNINNAYHDILLLREPKPDEFVPQVDIWAKVYDKPLALDDFSKERVDKMEKAGYTNIKFPITDVSIDGRPTLVIRSTDSYGFEAWTFLFTNSDAQGWSLEYTSPYAEFEPYRPDVLDAVSSIQITDE